MSYVDHRVQEDIVAGVNSIISKSNLWKTPNACKGRDCEKFDVDAALAAWRRVAGMNLTTQH